MKINHRTKLLSAGIICALMSGNVMAQEADFDLSSQRSEKQDVKPVPGKKIDHQGIVINPTPHQISVDRSQTCSLLEGIVLKDKQKAFANDLSFLKQQKKGVSLTIDFGAKVAARQNVKAVSGAYALSIGKKGITITGYDERGAFYGIQTLLQLFPSEVYSRERFFCFLPA